MGDRGGTIVSLSRREREILLLLAQGRTQTQIAAALLMSQKTVTAQIQHLLLKLGVSSRAQAVAAAYRRGLVEVETRSASHDPHEPALNA